MKMFYSAVTNAYYSAEIHGTMPMDAKELTPEMYAEMVTSRPTGKIVEPGDVGYPVLVDIPAPGAATSCTSLEYLERFTEAEQLAVVTAAMTNAPVRLWYDKLIAAQEVVFADPRVAAGLDALIAAGLLEADRKAALLTP